MLREAALSLQGTPRLRGWHRGQGDAVSHRGWWLPCKRDRAEHRVTQLGKPVEDPSSPNTALRTPRRAVGPHLSPAAAAAPILGGPAVGARSWAHNAQRDSRAPPGTATTKLPFIPWQLPPGPAMGGHGARDPPRAQGPTNSPALPPGGRGCRALPRHSRRQDGRGLWPDVTMTACGPHGPAAMNSWPRNAHQAARQSPLPAWGRPWGSPGDLPRSG